MKNNKVVYFLWITLLFIIIFYLILNPFNLANLDSIITFTNQRFLDNDFANGSLGKSGGKGDISPLGKFSEKVLPEKKRKTSRFLLNETQPNNCSKFETLGRSNLLKDYNDFKSDYTTPKAIFLPAPICPDKEVPLAVVGVISKRDEIQRRNIVCIFVV